MYEHQPQVTTTSEQARQNRAYVRMLLEKNSPAFAAMLEQAVRELSSAALDCV